MPRTTKMKNGERNYSCLHYSKCLTEAAITNSSFTCTGCEKSEIQNFNELLKYESTTDALEMVLRSNPNLMKKEKL